MAVGMYGHEPIVSFEQWYTDYHVDADGCLEYRNIGPCGSTMYRHWQDYKREMDKRVEGFESLEQLADGEVLTRHADLPNVSSGETASLIRRISRSVVQNCPNVEVVSKFDDDDIMGIFARYVLTSKVIGSDQYSNDMQQHLFASTKSAFTLGFDCVIPALLQDAGGGWYMKYDNIHYRDVFPEPGVKDIREAPCVYVRRYLTYGEVKKLIHDEAYGWDIAALRRMAKNKPTPREMQSVDHQTKKRHTIPDGYEIVTWYTNSGEPFLTFEANTKLLLRIEKNKHPLKEHPVHFLILEKDDNQPLGKSQVELLIGRQEFQDLMLNGAMKLWYRNINPTIFGFGVGNSVPNLSPGKYTQISNPNAKVEAFEVNTGTLMQFGQISQQNLGSMISLIGSADPQMAQSAGGGNGQGMSATPQGVDAQQGMVDITTNNYQKAIEAFFSHYCSYALTMFFQELQSIKKLTPTAEAKMRMVSMGLPVEKLNKDGTLDIDFAELATEYWVLCVPGSLTELEDEKQLRILNQMFIPLSQAMPALAATQDPETLQHAAAAMQYIVQKQIELSGSSSARDVKDLLQGKPTDAAVRDEKMENLERMYTETAADREAELEVHAKSIVQMQQQMTELTQGLGLLLQKLGVPNDGSSIATPETPEPQLDESQTAPTLATASA